MTATLCNIRCKVLYDFAGDLEQGQLPIKKGSIVTVTEKYDNGWWFADSNGEQGFVPADFVQEEVATPVTVKPLPSVPGGAGAAPAGQAHHPQPQAHQSKQAQHAPQIQQRQPQSQQPQPQSQQQSHSQHQQPSTQHQPQFALPGIGAAALASLKHHASEKAMGTSPRALIDKQGSPTISPRSHVTPVEASKPKVLAKAGSVTGPAVVAATIAKQNKPLGGASAKQLPVEPKPTVVAKQEQPTPEEPTNNSTAAQPVLFKAKALYEFAGDVAQEQIPLHVGEVVAVIETFDNGWWFGENSRKQQGFFPTDFVEKLPDLPAKPSKIIPPLKPAAAKKGSPASTKSVGVSQDKETRAAILIQKHVRRHLARGKYLKARRGVVHFQALYRGHRVRKYKASPQLDNSNALSRIPTNKSTPLASVTKGRPAGRGGRRPPTRGHKVESVQEQPRERLSPQVLAIAGGFGTSTEGEHKPSGGSAIVMSGPSLAPGFDPTKVNLRKTEGPQKLTVVDDSAIDFRKALHAKKMMGQSTENILTPLGKPLAAHGTINVAMLRQETDDHMSTDFQVDPAVRLARSTTVIEPRLPTKDLPPVPQSNIFTEAANKTSGSSEWKNKRFAVGKVLTSFFKARPKKEDLIEKKILLEGPLPPMPPSSIIADPAATLAGAAPASPTNSAIYNISSSPTSVSGIYQQSSTTSLDPFCTNCKKAFGLLTSKHHCRSCNKSFCSKCTKKKIALPQSVDKKPVRVCDSCFQMIWNAR